VTDPLEVWSSLNSGVKDEKKAYQISQKLAMYAKGKRGAGGITGVPSAQITPREKNRLLGARDSDVQSHRSGLSRQSNIIRRPSRLFDVKNIRKFS